MITSKKRRQPLNKKECSISLIAFFFHQCFSTASNVSTAALPLACTTPLTSSVASTVEKSSVLFLCRVYAPIFPSILLFTIELPTWLAFLINQFATVYVNYTLIVVRPSSIEAVGVRRSTEIDQSFYHTRLFQLIIIIIIIIY